MEIKELKKLLAGFSIVSLLAGGALLLPGCATDKGSTQEKKAPGQSS
ncbi:MAG: selenobiotic family radical SAM modification target peptide [Deltaproteobacteria bacterium]|jgi:radical SAM modification target selenobiotic family peptide|nr:selenobiotic family radical SAM modification target peptide [Deltaproteobacteria bacterium]